MESEKGRWIGATLKKEALRWNDGRRRKEKKVDTCQDRKEHVRQYTEALRKKHDVRVLKETPD